MLTVIRFKLRVVREAAELTQLELAERVGVRQATISDIETGKAKTLRLSLLDALCNVLSVAPADLLAYDPPRGARRSVT